MATDRKQERQSRAEAEAEREAAGLATARAEYPSRSQSPLAFAGAAGEFSGGLAGEFSSVGIGAMGRLGLSALGAQLPLGVGLGVQMPGEWTLPLWHSLLRLDSRAAGTPAAGAPAHVHTDS